MKDTPPSGSGKCSIKGSALTAVVDDVNRLRSSGRIDDALLDAHLEAPDRALLESQILPASWYPIDAYGRLTALLLEVDGRGRTEYLNGRGAATARRLIESGIYAQLERASGEGVRIDASMSREDQMREFGRTIRLVTSLSGSIFDFGRWQVGVDPDHADRFRITIEDVEAMPDVAIHTIEGFINAIGEASPHIKHLHWRGERRAPGTIVYTMDAGVDAVYGV
jgi:hypothetical protein